MGNGSAPVELAPLPEAIGLFSSYIARQSETLILKEKLSIGGDSFSVKTVDGRDVLQVKGEHLSLSGRKTITGTDGTVLFQLRKQTFSIPKTFYCEDPQGKRIFDVQCKFSIGSNKTYGKFHSTRGRDEVLFMKGDFFDTKATITDEATGTVVATIDRKFFNAKEMIFGKQTYAVTVAPGMDISLVVAMCVALDEKENEGKKGLFSGGGG